MSFLLMLLPFIQIFGQEEPAAVWRYASKEDITGLTISNLASSTEFSCAIYVPAQAFVGDEIRTIRIGLNESTKNLKLRIWEKLTEEPVYEEVIGDIEVTSSSKWKEFNLSKPFQITEEKPLYIGYSIQVEPGTKPIGVHTDITPRSNSFYFRQSTYDWEDLSSKIAPVCIQANVYGDNSQKRSIVVSGDASSVTTPGLETSIDLVMINSGSAAANVIDLEYTLNGKTKTLESQTLTARSFDQKVYPIKIKVPEEVGYYKATFKVTKIDGRDNDFKGKEHEVTIAVVENPAKRVIVCEELTGTGCGYCPRGIEGLKMMYEKHPNEFLGIGIHLFSDTDPMYINDGSYHQILTHMTDAPKCIINRNTSLIGDPYFDIEDMFAKESNKYPNMNVKMYVTPIDNNQKIEITTDLTFINSIEESNYRIAFVVLEDQVDKDKNGKDIPQFNGFSGNAGAMNGWGDRPEMVKWSFDDVARGIYNYNGLYNSVPSRIQAMQTYRYTYTLDMPYTLHFENVRIAALIINAETKLIENAGVIKYADFGQTPPPVGIDETVEEKNPVVVRTTENGFELASMQEGKKEIYLYSTSGILQYHKTENSSVATLPVKDNGIYIIRIIQDNHTTDLKVVK